jgi:hypothetical protein
VASSASWLARVCAISAGWAAALRPSMKKVARTHSCFSAFSTRSVAPGNGPSSKVSPISLGANSSVRGNCLRPTGAVCVGSIASTRSVPSAAGLPEQSAAADWDGGSASNVRLSSNKIRIMVASVRT